VDSTRTPLRPLDGGLDVRATRDVGRRARLELRFEERGGRTVLTHAYAEPPFRVGRPFRFDAGLHLIVASSAPGIFGGDAFAQTIAVGEGARVRLTSQSSMQGHPSADGAAATLVSTYRVDAGGHLQCEWDPVIPFRAARLEQRIQLDLAEDATLFWSDAFMAGREARGERWAFAFLASELRLTRNGSLDYLERYAICPSERAVDSPWLAGAACYFGTALIANPMVDRAHAERLHTTLGGVAGVRAVADLLEEGLLLARLMAASGVGFHEARRLARDGLRLGPKR
jgi:urease accessory protein